MANHPIAYALRCQPFKEVLTARQFRVYWHILDCYERTGRVVLRELARAAGLSVNGAHRHVTTLARKGWIRVEPGIAGGIVPLMRLEIFRNSVPNSAMQA